MSKTVATKNKIKRQENELDFDDLMLGLDSPDGEAVLGMMTGMLEAQRYQQQTALELTKLIVEKSGAMKEDEIFGIFKRAFKNISEVSPIKELFEKMSG